MTQRTDPEPHERRTTSSSGSSSSSGPASLQTTIAADGPSASDSPPSLKTTIAADGPPRETTARVMGRAFDPTIGAPSQDGLTPPASSERLSRLASRLPRVARDAYAVGAQVARGGIGRVLRARDERLDRPVAIKELLVWNASQERRFIREALLTARLQHPAIVPVYEAGRWPDGEPFYAMKLVSGRTLSDLIDERPTLAERLSLLPHVLTAAQAIAYAHSQRILHRDLKPANVLVGEFGETVVIDWGLAKGLNEADEAAGPTSMPADNGLTIEGSVMGTPAYMPPEQAKGAAVDERADIYALGAMLYHLIAAVPPYHDVPWEELLSTIASDPPRPILDHAPAISDELCAIVNKAMARDPLARYPTAKALADDLHRFQTGQIVAAHTYSSAQLLRRFWRRNRAALSIAGGALGLITMVVIGAFVKTDAERRFALAQQREAQAASIAAESQRKAAESAEQQATTRADEMTLLQAQGALDHDPNEAVAWLKTLSPSFTDAAELRRLATDARARGISRAFRGHAAYVNWVSMIDGGKRFVTSSDDKTVRVWDAATAESRVLAGHNDEVWRTAAFPDGKRIVSTSKDRTVRVWDVATGATLSQASLPAAAKQVVVREDGSILGASFGEGPAWLWTPGSPEPRLFAEPSERMITSAISDDTRTAVSRRVDGTVFVTDTISGKRRSVGRDDQKRDQWMLTSDGRVGVAWKLDGTTTSVQFELWDLKAGTKSSLSAIAREPSPAFSPRGQLFAVAYRESIDIYDVATHQLARRFAGFGSDVLSIQFSDDDRILAIGSYDRTVRTIDLLTEEIVVHAGLNGPVSALAFLPHQHALVAASAVGEVRLFEPPRDGAILTTGAAKSFGLAVALDGRTATISNAGLLRITDPSGKTIAEHTFDPAPSRAMRASPDRERFAGIELARDDSINIEETEAHTKNGSVILGTFDGAPPTLVRTPGEILSSAWHPAGEFLLVGLRDGSILKIGLDGALTPVASLPAAVTSLAASKDGTQIAAGDVKGLVRVFDQASGAARDLGQHANGVFSLAFSGAGGWLATGSLDHTARLWRLSDGTFRSFAASGGGVRRVAFSADNKTLFTLSNGETFLRRWSVESGEALIPFGGHQGGILHFSFSDDGRRVVTTSFDRTARIYDAVTGKSRALRDLAAPVMDAAFAQGGKQVITLNWAGTVRAFPDDLPETMPELRAWLDATTPDRIEKH